MRRNIRLTDNIGDLTMTTEIKQVIRYKYRDDIYETKEEAELVREEDELMRLIGKESCYGNLTEDQVLDFIKTYKLAIVTYYNMGT